jgi:protein-tyrosine phosphatase
MGDLLGPLQHDSPTIIILLETPHAGALAIETTETPNRSPRRILFVCLGNICRSPTAEGVFRHLLAEEAAHLGIEVDSAGTGDYHIGEPPDPRSQRAAARIGIDLSGLRARQVVPTDFMQFDLILAMDRQNLRALQALRPPGSKAVLALFLDYAGVAGPAEVPDPYLGTGDEFERVLERITTASRRLIAILKKRP